jgi:hypothetical protein
MAVVKGGEIRGSIMVPSKNLDQPLERLARTEVKAKKKPRIVPDKPTKVARRRLFQKACKWWRLLKISKILAKVKCPLFSNVNMKIFDKGKRINNNKKHQITTILNKIAGSLGNLVNTFFLNIFKKAGIFSSLI